MNDKTSFFGGQPRVGRVLFDFDDGIRKDMSQYNMRTDRSRCEAW